MHPSSVVPVRMNFGACVIASVAVAFVTGCGGSTTSISEIAAPDAVRCQTSVASPPSTVPHGGSRVSLTVVANRDCSWTARSEASWAQVSPASGQGQATLSVNVAANPNASTRSGSIVINDTRLNLTQEAAPCRFALGSARSQIGHEGGTATVTVSAASGCAWRASSNAQAWARVMTDSGTGSGTVEIAVAANAGGERSATITVADQTLLLVQEARPSGPAQPPPGPGPSPNPVCAVTLDSSERSFPASGGDASIRVVAPAGCAWSASVNAPWVDVSNSSGTGTDTVRYRVAANSGASPRTATITVAGRSHTVRQDGAPVSGGGGGGGGEEQKIELSGRAFLVDGSCPSISFVLEFRRVFTTGDTKFKGKGDCRQIRSGTELEVKGRVQSDGRVRATEVRVEDDDD